MNAPAYIFTLRAPKPGGGLKKIYSSPAVDTLEAAKRAAWQMVDAFNGNVVVATVYHLRDGSTKRPDAYYYILKTRSGVLSGNTKSYEWFTMLRPKLLNLKANGKA